MKNKVVIYILIAYFILLTIVLIIQIPKKDTPTTEPIATELKYEEKLKNAVVFHIGSPLAVINEAQTIIDENNANVVPEIINGSTYVPATVFRNAFGASVDRNIQTLETTIRYNNKAIIFTDNDFEIQVIDNNSEKTKTIEAKPLIMHDKVYVPLKIVAESFNKEIFFDNNLIIVSDIKDIFNPETEADKLSLLREQIISLPSVGSEEKLKALISQTAVLKEKENIALDVAETATVQTELSKNDYSQTNNQVDSVDEADIIKTDGQYIYYVRENNVEIVYAAEAENMNSVSEISFDNSFTPKEIFIKDKKLIVIGNKTMANNASSTLMQALIYELEDVTEPKLIRTIDTEGTYFNSRMIENTLYLISTANVFNLSDGKNYRSTSYMDSALQDSRVNIGFENIKYFPDMASNNYTTIISLNVNDITKAADVKTYLGSGSDIYVSQNNLYFICHKANINIYSQAKVESNIYKFTLKDGKVEFSKRAFLPGAVLNQFSMDEKDGYFRVATTQFKNNRLSNNLFVYNSELEVCGKIENIAPNEKIYSARFIGDKAYLVTFETVDPLFVIDLKNPNSPQILGELKIPGYSNYLHPYDENHIIGFGKDTIVHEGTAYYQGIKLTMFDVSDFNNPKEMFSELIGDRGTDSIALNNHKAFLFDKDKNILAFPINLYIKEEDANELDYGLFTYQGAYVYGFDMENGFSAKANISHNEQLASTNEKVYDENIDINRIIYIGNTLYTASNNKIVATDLTNFEKIGEINFDDANNNAE